MTTTPTTNNTDANAVNAIIGGLGGTIVSVVEDAIITDAPFLGFPLVKPIWEALFSWIASYFIKAAENGATFAVIDHQVGVEESAVSKALLNLILAEKGGDPSAIKSAIQAYADAQSALIHSDGSATPQ